MKLDILGRINNMRLPDGKAAILYAVYEAVSNSVHAIEDRFKKNESVSKGKIEVEILRDNEKYIDKIIIHDNGIGFTRQNQDSFNTSDSRFKETRGGKGVGRLIWIKVLGPIPSPYGIDGLTPAA